MLPVPVLTVLISKKVKWVWPENLFLILFESSIAQKIIIAYHCTDLNQNLLFCFKLCNWYKSSFFLQFIHIIKICVLRLFESPKKLSIKSFKYLVSEKSLQTFFLNINSFFQFNKFFTGSWAKKNTRKKLKIASWSNGTRTESKIKSTWKKNWGEKQIIS